MKWTGKIIDGLAYIRSQDILQADARCHNLLLDKDGDLKLCDSGGSSIDAEKATVYYERRSQYPTRSRSYHGIICSRGYVNCRATIFWNQLRHRRSSKPLRSRNFPSAEHLMLGKIMKKCWGVLRKYCGRSFRLAASPVTVGISTTRT